MPGAQCTRSLAWKKYKPHERSHHRSIGKHPTFPHAMVLTVYLRALPGDQGLFDTVTGGIGVSGPIGPTSPPAGLTPTLRRQDHTIWPVRCMRVRPRAS
jgi:hypothetical protein